LRNVNANYYFLILFIIDGLVRFTKEMRGGISFDRCEFSGNNGKEARVFYIANNLVEIF
jgi:hypothetical protein